MKQFKKIIISLVVAASIVTLCGQKACAFIDLLSGDVDSFQEKKLKEKEELLGFYYDLVKQNHFSSQYANNLIFSADIDNDFPRNGAILLKLIEYLEKDASYASKFLLKKINSFFYLELHSFISHVEIPQEQRAHLYKTMHALYNCKAPKIDETVGQGEERAIYPFRTLLSQVTISIHIALNSPERRNRQREALVFVLEELKTKILDVNQANNLIIGKEVIDEFVTLLEAYAVQEDVVNKGNVQRALYITGFVLIVVAIVVYIGSKGGFPWVVQKGKEFVGAITDVFLDKVEGRVGPMVKKAVHAADTEQLGDGLVAGALRRVNADGGQTTEKLLDQVGAKAREIGDGLMETVRASARPLVREVLEEFKSDDSAPPVKDPVNTATASKGEASAETAVAPQVPKASKPGKVDSPRIATQRGKVNDAHEKHAARPPAYGADLFD